MAGKKDVYLLENSAEWANYSNNSLKLILVLFPSISLVNVSLRASKTSTIVRSPLEAEPTNYTCSEPLLRAYKKL